VKTLVSAFCVLVLVASALDSGAQTPGKSDGLAEFATLFQEQRTPEASGPALTLDEVERIALARNPEIEVAVRRVAIAEAHVSGAGSLDDASVMYRGWGVPLEQPWDYNSAQNM